MEELFTHTPPDDKRAALTVTAIGDRCSVICTWSYEGVSVDIDPAAARALGTALIGWADGR